MKKSSHIVTDYDVRPAGKPAECFYCHATIGAEHFKGCVRRQRTVVVRLSALITLPVPEDWDVRSIEHSFNESSYCAGNAAAFLPELQKRRDSFCLCDSVCIIYLREATAEDEARDNIFVEKLDEEDGKDFPTKISG